MDKVASLPPNVPPYESQVAREDLEQWIDDAVENSLGGFGSAPSTVAVIANMRVAATDTASTDALLNAWPLVTRFVRAELDTETAGERGIGRTSTTPPRLGGAFRDPLRSPDARRVFGRLSERLVVAGWTAQAANQQNFAEGPFVFRERETEAIWLRWVPGIYASDRGAGPTTRAVLDRALGPFADDVRDAATKHGFLAGLRAKKKRATLDAVSAFHFRAGIGLRAHCTSQTDGEY